MQCLGLSGLGLCTFHQGPRGQGIALRVQNFKKLKFKQKHCVDQRMCVHIHPYEHIQTCMHVNRCVHMHTCMQVHTCVKVHTCLQVHTWVLVHMCVQVHIAHFFKKNQQFNHSHSKSVSPLNVICKLG